MNFQPTKKARHSKLKIFTILVVCIILLSAIMPKTMSSFFMAIFSPFWKIEQSVQTSGFFHSRAGLYTENTQLKSELDAIRGDAATIGYLENENNELKALLGRPQVRNAVLATILSSPPFSPYDTVVIDAGKSEGVAIGSLIYVPDMITIAGTSANETSTSTGATSSSTSTQTELKIPKISIGKVTDIFSHTSRVELYSSAGQKFQVEIGKNHVKAEATGRGGGSFEIIIPRDADVHVGDAIIIPSIETIVFGQVGTIVSDPARAYSTVLFNLPVNPFQLHSVLVQLPNPDGTLVSPTQTPVATPAAKSKK